jgi:tRNA uridine 5-carbamoylmethylation protein Kti12
MASSTKPILVALTGLPSSGKSTFAGKLALEMDKSHGFSVMVVSSDAVRAEFPVLSSRFLPELENAVRRLTLARVRDALREGFPVILDDLNYYRSMRRQAFAIARDLRLPYFLVHLATPEKRCLELNAARGRKIPDDVIVTDSVRFDPPGEEPWDEAFLSLSADDGMDAAVTTAAADMVRRAPEFVPPLDDPGTGPLERTRKEELELLSRDVVGRLCRRHGGAGDAKRLREERLRLVDEAAARGLENSEAKKLFTDGLGGLFG